MIDWDRVGQLRDEIGAEDFDEVAELFLLEVEESLSQLDGAMGDPTRLAELLHFLKGSALNLGFESFSEMCRRGEVDACSSGVSFTAIELIALYDASKDLFQKEFATRFAA